MRQKKFKIVAAVSIGLAVFLALSWQQGLLRVPDSASLDPAQLSGSIAPTAEGWPLEFRTVDWSETGPYRDRLQAIIRSEAEWRELNRKEKPSGEPFLPPVDWDRNVLVLVTMGEESGQAKTMKVVGVRQEGSELQVDLEIEDAGGPHAGAPFHLITVPATDVDRLIIRELTAGAHPDPEPGVRPTTWGNLKTKFGS